MDLRTAVENVKQQVQKQKTAVVLGAFGVLASGLTLAGKLQALHVHCCPALLQERKLFFLWRFASEI